MNKSRVSGFYETTNVESPDHDGDRQTVPVPPPAQSPEVLAARLLDIQASIDALREQERSLGASLLTHMVQSGTEAITVGVRGSVMYVEPQALHFVDGERAGDLLRELGYPVPFFTRFHSETLRVARHDACIDPKLLADEDELAPSTRREGGQRAS